MDVVVLLMTDVVGSTALWASEPDAMNAAMARHHEIVHGAVASHGGWLPRDQGEGDAVFAGFASASEAVSALADIQLALAAETWPTSTPLTVRAGAHAGEVIRRDGNLFGDTVNRCARIRGLGYGGQTLLSAAVYELVRDRLPRGAGITPLGEHRMKDLTRAEPIYQLDVPGLPKEFPALKSLDRVVHNLTVQPTPLLGRDAAVAEIRELLGAHGLVTILGFGGLGKTRLSLQVAAELAGRDETTDGVWFVDLASITDPAKVPSEIAAAVALAEDGEPALLAWLGDKKLLLVLDNLEQVLGCAPLVAKLVAAGPGVRVLATSREPLRVRGEQTYALGPLGVPPADVDWSRDLAELGTYAAVELFVSRAREVRHDFAVTSDSAPAVAAICAVLDGMPLAIELAAARVKMLEPEALLERLDNALSVLTRGGADRPERQRTLRATIAWSYDLLSDNEKLLLDRMSVFPSAATLTSIEGTCAGEEFDSYELFEDLTSLVERSLVSVTPPAKPGQREAYLLFVSIREFAAEKLAGRGGTETTMNRLVRQLRARFGADTAAEATLPDRRQEFLNLRVAFAWTLANGSPEDIVTFPEIFLWLLFTQWRMTELIDAATNIQHAHPGHHPSKFVWLHHWGYCLEILGDEPGFRRIEQQAIDEARGAGDTVRLIDALSAAAIRGSDHQVSLDRIAECERLLLDLGEEHPEFEGAMTEILDATLRVCPLSDLARAEHAARSLLEKREFGSQAYLSTALEYAIALSCAGGPTRWPEALHLLEPWEGESLTPETVRTDVYAGGRVRLAQLLVKVGELERARAIAVQTISVLDGWAQGWCGNMFWVLATVEFTAGDYAAALAMMTAAAELSPHFSRDRFACATSILHRLLGNTGEAARHLDRAVETAELAEPGSLDRSTWGVAVELAWRLALTDPTAAASRVPALRAQGSGVNSWFLGPAFWPGDQLDALIAHLTGLGVGIPAA